MEYVIIALLIIVFITLIVLILKVNKNTNNDTSVSNTMMEFRSQIVESLLKNQNTLTKEIGEFKYEFSDKLNKDFKTLSEGIEARLIKINEIVNTRIDENFEKTNKTFNNILERLTKIDDAQKKIDSLSNDIVSLQSILTDKKTRGNFGEFTLESILANVFGEKNDKMYNLQYTLSNGYIADSVIHTYEPLGNICIDSKFPLENFNRMIDSSLSKEERVASSKAFKSDVKKHIDAIASKYIVAGETTNQAIMFIPAEAIFAEINAHHEDIVNYAYKNHIWMTSPTTLMFMLTTVGMVVKTKERDKFAKVIQVELGKLAEDFERYKERWEKLARSIDTVSKDVKDINITTDKITNRFNMINKVEITNKLDTKEIE